MRRRGFLTGVTAARAAAAALAMLAVFVLGADTALAAGAKAPKPPKEKPVVVVLDRFAGAGSSLESHAPKADREGGGWTVALGQWQVERGRAEEITGQDTPYRAVIDPNVVNVEISTEVTWPGSAEVGLVFRYEDADNWFGYLYDGRQVKLAKSVGGELTTLKRRAARWQAGESRVMAVTVDGSEIAATLDGKEGLRVDDSDLQGRRKVGFYYVRETETEFTEFEVRALGPAVTPGILSFPGIEDSVLFDSFGGSGALSAHSPDKAPAGGWSEASGAWQVSGGEASETTGSNVDNRAFIDSGLTDVDLYADVTWQGGLAGVVYRYADEWNWYMSWTDGGHLLTGRLAGGAFSLLRVMPFDWGPAGTTRTMRVRINGTSIRIYVDEDLPLSILLGEDDLASESGVGLFSRSGPASTFDRLAAAPAPALPVPDPDPPPPGPDPEKCPQPATPPGMTVYDSFSDYPLWPLTWHEPDAAPAFRRWVGEQGAWFDNCSAMTEMTGALTDQRAVIDSGVEESVVSATVKWDQGTVGMVFRYRNEHNWFQFWYDGVDSLVVGKFVGGWFTELGRVPYDWKRGKTHRLWVETDVEDARAMIDKREVMSFSVAELPASTKAGLFVRSRAPGLFDDFAVVALPDQPPPPSGSFTPLVQDSFTAPDGESLSSHIPDLTPGSAPWVEASGVWRIDGGQAHETLGYIADFRAVVEAAAGDVQVKADVTWHGAIAGLVLRYQDEGNWYMAWYDGWTLLIGKNVAGAFSLIHALPLEWGPPGTTREMMIEAVGDSITVFIDGTDLVTLTGETDLADASKVGIFALGSVVNSFDNFVVGTKAP